MTKASINDVTDTALWVASYRAEETERQDALFLDPYAKLLVGSEELQLAHRTQGSRYTAWSVIIRTCIIDQFIIKLIAEGIDTIVNLGAGLDTRPYRLNLPANLRWIEVDFPNIIDLKNEKLNLVAPQCVLQRVAMDLSIKDERNSFFSKISNESKKVLILTEGVVPYLSNEETSSLGNALFAQENFSFWVTEYYSPEILNFLKTPKRIKQMKNAPFLFHPNNWFLFFRNIGWSEKETTYFVDESLRLKRTPPTPGWLKTMPTDAIENNKLKEMNKYLGFTIFQRS